MKNKGITIIALIVTIIVLLILASVSIAMITGENGILSKAKLSKENSNSAEIEEQNRLGQYNESMDKYTTSRGTVTLTTEEYQIFKNTTSYSEEEKQIGTWTDGSALYRKTYYNTTTTASNTYGWNLSTLNIKKVVHVYGTVNRNDGYVMPLMYGYTSSDMNSVYFSPDLTQMGFNSVSSGYYSQNATITIEYIKK